MTIKCKKVKYQKKGREKLQEQNWKIKKNQKLEIFRKFKRKKYGNNLQRLSYNNSIFDIYINLTNLYSIYIRCFL
jgi:hypothetical protein